MFQILILIKRHLVVFLIISVLINSSYSQNLSSSVAFEERVYDFGTILEKNGKVAHTFIFQNKGKTPVTITDIYSGCGCIGKVLTKDPVKPGGKGKVIITFDPGYKSGFFSKEIVVFSNNGQDYNRVWVEGVIKPMQQPVENDYPYNFGNGLYLRLKVVAFGYLEPGQTKEMKVHYANSTNREMTLHFAVEGNKKGLVFESPGKIAAKAKGVVSFFYTMPASAVDDAIFKVYPFVNGRKLTESLDIKILNKKKLYKQQPVK